MIDEIEVSEERFSRQSFLGDNAQQQIATCVVGVVGLGGGGSHIVQQLAHLGFQRYVLYDDDVVEDSNLNRLVGGTTADEQNAVAKLEVAQRLILGLQPNAQIQAIADRWQREPEPLRSCQVVFGCVDSYQGRHELEVTLRRYLINYIDIGMDVHGIDPPLISGQVILSTPGGPCLKCLGFLTDEKLRQEASQYGNAGSRPQVVWPNGVLASTAIGMGINLITNWTAANPSHNYLVYNGSRGTMQPSVTLRNCTETVCPHHPLSEIGDPVLLEL